MRKTIAPCKKSNNTNAKKATTPHKKTTIGEEKHH
jgi:hypothetical protein